MPAFHCKKCEGKSFSSISALRKHQWTDHSETFANLRKASKNRKGKRKYTRKIEPSQNGNLTAEQLLEKLRAQKDFMTDIVAMVERMLK